MLLPFASFAGYIPRVHWFGDSIPYGVGSSAICGPREPAFLAARSAGAPFVFVGTQIFAGDAGGMTTDPYCECYPGITAVNLNGHINTLSIFLADVAIYSAGTNDIAGGATPADVAAAWSDALDGLWSRRPSPHFRIIITTILKRLDAFDSTVQAANALLPSVVAGKSYASSVSVCDLYACIPNPTVGVNMHDQVHPNDVGDTEYGQFLYTNTLAAVVAQARWS